MRLVTLKKPVKQAIHGAQDMIELDARVQGELYTQMNTYACIHGHNNHLHREQDRHITTNFGFVINRGIQEQL